MDHQRALRFSRADGEVWRAERIDQYALGNGQLNAIRIRFHDSQSELGVKLAVPIPKFSRYRHK